jgi:hypothetical protein
MAEHDEREEDVSRRYGELPREEPPPALDAAIRAHARSAVERHAAPLVPPAGRRQWYFPLAAAAILVLAVAVTWHVEREQPDMVAVVPSAEPARTMKAEEAQPPPAPEAPPRAKVQAERRAEAPIRDRAGENKDAREAEALAKQSSPAEAPAPAAPAARADEAQPRPQLGAMARSEAMRERAFAETPEQWLERIAKLRTEGKHDQADQALAEFRKRYPDFRIPAETLEKVEKK